MNEIQIPPKHTLVKTGDYETLYRNGKPLHCYEQSPYIEQTQMGGIQKVIPFCGSHCPKFDLRVKENKLHAITLCGTHISGHEISNDKVQQPVPPRNDQTKILTL